MRRTHVSNMKMYLYQLYLCMCMKKIIKRNNKVRNISCVEPLTELNKMEGRAWRQDSTGSICCVESEKIQECQWIWVTSIYTWSRKGPQTPRPRKPELIKGPAIGNDIIVGMRTTESSLIWQICLNKLYSRCIKKFNLKMRAHDNINRCKIRFCTSPRIEHYIYKVIL